MSSTRIFLDRAENDMKFAVFFNALLASLNMRDKLRDGIEAPSSNTGAPRFYCQGIFPLARIYGASGRKKNTSSSFAHISDSALPHSFSSFGKDCKTCL